MSKSLSSPDLSPSLSGDVAFRAEPLDGERMSELRKTLGDIVSRKGPPPQPGNNARKSWRIGGSKASSLETRPRTRSGSTISDAFKAQQPGMVLEPVQFDPKTYDKWGHEVLKTRRHDMTGEYPFMI